MLGPGVSALSLQPQMEPAIGTRTWYGVRRWGCHYLTRWFRCPPGVEAGLETGGINVTPSQTSWYQYTASVLSPDALDNMHWSMGAEWGRCVSTCRHWRLPRPSPGGGYRPCPHMLALAPAGASICHRCHLASEATAVTRPQDNWLVDSLVGTKQVWGCAGSRRWGVLKDGLGNVVGVENGGRAGLRLGPGCRSVRCACLRRPALLQGSPEGPCSTPTTGAGGGVSPHAGAGAGDCWANNERENRDPGTPSWVPHLMCQGSLGVAVGTG